MTTCCAVLRGRGAGCYMGCCAGLLSCCCEQLPLSKAGVQRWRCLGASKIHLRSAQVLVVLREKRSDVCLYEAWLAVGTGHPPVQLQRVDLSTQLGQPKLQLVCIGRAAAGRRERAEGARRSPEGLLRHTHTHTFSADCGGACGQIACGHTGHTAAMVCAHRVCAPDAPALAC